MPHHSKLPASLAPIQTQPTNISGLSCKPWGGEEVADPHSQHSFVMTTVCFTAQTTPSGARGLPPKELRPSSTEGIHRTRLGWRARRGSRGPRKAHSRCLQLHFFTH